MFNFGNYSGILPGAHGEKWTENHRAKRDRCVNRVLLIKNELISGLYASVALRVKKRRPEEAPE
jgi:hypothetical protein